jgi:tellurite methyltransferase
MMSDIQTKWDTIYNNKEHSPAASFVLTQNQHLLPRHGTALDLACGQGGNAVLLAKAGLDVSAWDVSPIVISQLEGFADSNNLSINAQVRDVAELPPEPNSLDVLVVSFFLDRHLCKSLLAALRPGGLLFYQTYCQQKVEQQGPRNANFLLADNELLSLFSTMKVRVYREESLLGDHQQGWRNQALLVAQK